MIIGELIMNKKVKENISLRESIGYLFGMIIVIIWSFVIAACVVTGIRGFIFSDEILQAKHQEAILFKAWHDIYVEGDNELIYFWRPDSYKNVIIAKYVYRDKSQEEVYEEYQNLLLQNSWAQFENENKTSSYEKEGLIFVVRKSENDIIEVEVKNKE